MNHKKSRLTDLFRKMDKDNNGMIPRDVFIDGILNTSKFLEALPLTLQNAQLMALPSHRIRHLRLGNEGCSRSV